MSKSFSRLKGNVRSGASKVGEAAQELSDDAKNVLDKAKEILNEAKEGFQEGYHNQSIHVDEDFETDHIASIDAPTHDDL